MSPDSTSADIPVRKVALLAGGTGGAKLARGFAALAGVELTVIANTGDDIEIYGGLVCPDPDLVAFHLADLIDERGWGLAGDTFNAMDQLDSIGAEAWFRLGDRDLAICLERARRIASGETLTESIEAIFAPMLGSAARVLPMCDEPVRTAIRSGSELIPFQEFMIKRQARAPIDAVELQGLSRARPTSAVTAAIRSADAIIIGPSNPVISIGPILAVPGLADLLTASSAPKIAVSPLVGGVAIKGPTEAFLTASGVSADSEGIAGHYRSMGLCDGLVADSSADGCPTRVTDVLMDTVEAKVRVAAETLTFALELSR